MNNRTLQPRPTYSGRFQLEFGTVIAVALERNKTTRNIGKLMIRSQGKYFTQDELNRIVLLLRDTDMNFPDIACRMRCSRSAIAAINRKFQVRVYDGKRTHWNLNWENQTAAPIAPQKPRILYEVIRNES